MEASGEEKRDSCKTEKPDNSPSRNEEQVQSAAWQENDVNNSGLNTLRNGESEDAGSRHELKSTPLLGRRVH